MPYADWTYYSETYGGTASEEEAEPMLERASDAVDSVTFSRINAIGWERLTAFQQDLVRKACCIQADFLMENGDAVETALSAYSINGVSLQFGNDALYKVVGGTAMDNRAYSMLQRTGLAALMAYPREVR